MLVSLIQVYTKHQTLYSMNVCMYTRYSEMDAGDVSTHTYNWEIICYECNKSF